ncbi:MAG: PhzF family phenazine biosynthesis protein [Clostridia bacterium]|nr:PhzF family phenazine biosynthesis protein [Clostridia bacterium]
MKQYIVDAFTDKLFSGNPAAVCIMDRWPSDEDMLNIACENNLSETAFCVKYDNIYKLRWFTPKDEIDLCGHATLATAFVIKNFIERERDVISFDTLSGRLTVSVIDNVYEMTFPAYRLNKVAVTNEMEQSIGIRPIEAYKDRDLLMVIDNEDAVKNMSPDFALLKRLDGLCIAVTARSQQYDCISRVFAPELSIPEDPVTGSTHCMIAPYWADKLGKSHITAFQASERTGLLMCEVCNDGKVKISGKAALYAISEIMVN